MKEDEKYKQSFAIFLVFENYLFACCTRHVFAIFSDSGIVIVIIGPLPVAFGDGLWTIPWVSHRFIFAVSAMAIASVPTVIRPIIFYIR